MFKDPKTLTRRALQVLKLLAVPFIDGEVYEPEIVCDGGSCWIGTEKTTRRVVGQLLEAVLVKWDCDGKCDRYEINESGRRFLDGEKPYRDANGVFYSTMFDLWWRERRLKRRGLVR